MQAGPASPTLAEPKALFAINPDLDRTALAARFARDKRIQIRDVLTQETAQEIRAILTRATPWGLAMQAGESGQPVPVTHGELQTAAGKQRAQTAVQQAGEAARRGEYAFQYGRYSLVENLLARTAPDGPHDLLLEYLNAPDFLSLAREVTGIAELAKADGTATLFAPGHWLGRHIDSHVAQGWRVAYVLNLAPDDWHPDWGGHLVFYDEDGDIEAGYRPRFNCLNMFLVPQSHAVAYVPPFAPAGRIAITGWLRDR